MRMSDWSSDVCSSDVCSSDLEPLSRNLVVVSTFSMFAEIKTLALDLWADAQAGEQVGDEDCNGGANGRPDNRGDNRCRLNAKLRTDTDRTVSGAAQRRRVDDGGAKSADHAANEIGRAHV